MALTLIVGCFILSFVVMRGAVWIIERVYDGQV
jgi:hypothetical protein